MDDIRAGLMVRAVRLRRGLRQTDVAAAIGMSRETVSRVERGEPDALTLRTLRAVSRALGMPPLVSIGWRGAEVGALLDEGHAAIVERVVRALGPIGWEIVLEYSFNHHGDRGSVDIVAWHPATQTLLLIEVKTRIVDLQDLIGTLDRKERVVPALLAAERGWNARSLGVMLVAPDTSATRRAIARHAATFAAALPQRGAAVRRWLASPSGRLRGIWLLSDSRRV